MRGVRRHRDFVEALRQQVIKFSDENAIIETQRLRLVPLVQAHASSLFPILSDGALYEFTQETPPVSLSALSDRFALLESRHSPDGTQSWLNWLLLESSDAIGYVQATVTGAEADVAWVVGVPWHCQGYATEAAAAMILWLQAVGVRVIRAKIHPTHSASQRVAVKVGFSPTHEVVDGEAVWVFAAK